MRKVITVRDGSSPQDLTRFLVHLGKHDTNPRFWHGARAVIDQLLEKALPYDIREGLRELIAQYGLS